METELRKELLCKKVMAYLKKVNIYLDYTNPRNYADRNDDVALELREELLLLKKEIYYLKNGIDKLTI